MYSSIWEGIKNLPIGEKLQVRIRDENVRRVIQAVKKEKNRDCGIKKKLELLRPGPLTISKVPEIDRTGKETGYWIVSFSLPWDGTRL